MAVDVSTDRIREWRSIITLVVFVLTNCIVLWQFTIPFYVPRICADGLQAVLVKWRVMSCRKRNPKHIQRRYVHRKDPNTGDLVNTGTLRDFTCYRFPMNMVTAPLIAVLFLLATGAIGRTEVRAGTIGADDIKPYDVMVFFLTLAYIALSVDASGLIRYLAFRVLKWGGKAGRRLYFYLYAFWFTLGTFIGNDPLILSGTPFLVYLTQASSNVVNAEAWIFTQLIVANIASAILVSSNPTNLVLAGAFNIKFITYTANMIVPVIATAILLYPYLLYWVFRKRGLVPKTIDIHDLPESSLSKEPVNPNIPNAHPDTDEEGNDLLSPRERELHALEEIMNPFLDKSGAWFGAVLLLATLVTVLALNAASAGGEEHPVFFVTLPAAVIMFCWDMSWGWIRRDQTRTIAKNGRIDIERRKTESRLRRARTNEKTLSENEPLGEVELHASDAGKGTQAQSALGKCLSPNAGSQRTQNNETEVDTLSEDTIENGAAAVKNDAEAQNTEIDHNRAEPDSLWSLRHKAWDWAQETFPTPTTVLKLMPFSLIAFSFCMFILVQGLSTKGWVPVFAHGWDKVVSSTSPVLAILLMALLSALLCNFAGTNIGATILLSRVIQAWVEIHRLDAHGKQELQPISERDYWGTIYAMAIGVNFGAFSLNFSASLVGLLWRHILARKGIQVSGLQFNRVNNQVIYPCLLVACAVLVGVIYIFRADSPIRL